MKFQIALALLFSMSVFSQITKEEKKIYNFLDSIIGHKNTGLSYGSIFSEKFRTLNGNHQYFNNNEFVEGEVTYQNQTYYNVNLKYDLSDDHLIVNISNQYTNTPVILEKAKVSSFKIYDIHFINTEDKGYLEVIYTSADFSFFKKNTKRKTKKLNESFVYYKYLDEHTFYITVKKSTSEIRKIKDLIDVFPKQKKQIDLFYRANKKMYTQNKNEFYKLLGYKLTLYLKEN